MKVMQFPLAKITIGFVLGIMLSFYEKPNPETAFLLLIVSFIAFWATYFFSKKDFTQKIYFGTTLYTLSFLIGVTTQVTHTDYFKKNNYIHLVTESEKDHLVEVVLREKLKSTSFSDRYIAIVKRLDNKERTGKILINFYRSPVNTKLKIGTNIQIKGAIIKHKPINNPDQFDYGNYLIQKSIFAQMYVDAYDIKISSKIDTDFWFYSDWLRNRILTNLKESGFANDELHVVAALILGQQQDISPEILHDYQFAGAIHILSVSGLHIGFIVLFINFLLKPLPKNKFGSYLKLSIILFSLWGFAFLAGLSPSVVRSVTMFSFVAVGMHLKRKTNVYHTLLASIFFILLFQPSFLFDVGFQLSYVALFFILWLQPLLSGIWTPKNKIQSYFWDILTVSFAAQIGAFPLSIYYFHQFPGLFFITNLIILPGLGIIMALGVFLMVLAALGYIPLVLSKMLEWSIYILNKTINWVASFERFIIQDIPFNLYMLISLYLMITAVIIWFKKPNPSKMMAVLVTVLLFQVSYFGTIWNTQNQKELIVFNVKKSTLIGERTGNDVTLFSKDYVVKNTVIKSYLVANFSAVEKQKPLQNVIYFNRKKILIIDSLGIYSNTIKPNIMVITQSPKINLERLFQKNRPEMVVADASNYKTYIKIWKATCYKEKIPFHATGEKGFYKLQ
ncbi:competence protein ComEC [Flavobacterium psychrotolerans]|uniref:Competence protein ComEC n=2 Tax=Flavobacterium psychrotolerans TaxID=2169410 RepID=A0A2U1JG33_9FLAO|nr:competence protein ComEC [Flavobacterium psychrotolerans]